MKVTEIALTMEAAAKDTLKLQSSKESEANKVTNGSNSVPSPVIMAIDVVVLNMNHLCITLGMKCARNEGNWATPNECVTRERVNSTQQRKDEKPNLRSFEEEDEHNDDSLVALLEVNKWQVVMSSG